jgi:hypothetical protein
MVTAFVDGVKRLSNMGYGSSYKAVTTFRELTETKLAEKERDEENESKEKEGTKAKEVDEITLC